MKENEIYEGTIQQLTLKLYLDFFSGLVSHMVNYDVLKKIQKNLYELTFSKALGKGKVKVPKLIVLDRSSPQQGCFLKDISVKEIQVEVDVNIVDERK